MTYQNYIISRHRRMHYILRQHTMYVSYSQILIHGNMFTLKNLDRFSYMSSFYTLTYRI